MTKNYHVDLSDPRARDLLLHGTAPRGPRQVVHLAGDQDTGLRSGINLSSGKTEIGVVYGDLFLTVDLYTVPGEPHRLQLICPRCHKHLTVPGDRKAIDFEPAALNPVRSALVASGNPDLIRIANLGRLSVEAFECPWELGDEAHVQGGLHTGVTLCRQRLVIDKNRARDA